MNILIIDTDNNVFNLLNNLSSIEPNWNLIKFNHTLEQYKKNNIDFVLVDFSSEENEKILKEILKINQNQKTITISESLNCSELNGCDFCVINYNRRRLLKPINIKNLYDIIKNFSSEKCKYFNSFQHIDLLLPEILKRFNLFSYNENTKTIHHKEGYNENYQMAELLEIVSILNENSIKYNILYNTDIELV